MIAALAFCLPFFGLAALVVWLCTGPRVKRSPNAIYLIGSLRNPRVPQVAEELRAAGFEVFDDWYSAGPTADDTWRDYEHGRRHGFIQALKGYAAQHTFHFDKTHLDRCGIVVLLLPAGKSGHLELGYALGRKKRGYIVLDTDPERFDVMYNFATVVVPSVEALIEELRPSTDHVWHGVDA